MKKPFALFSLSVVAIALNSASAQTNDPGRTNRYPAFSTNSPQPPPPSWTNLPASAVWTNHPPHVLPATRSPGAPSPQFPADVQASVQQFQKARDGLVSQLKSANEAQRKEILQQLEQLRQQLKEQIIAIARDAQSQAGTCNSSLPTIGTGCSTRAHRGERSGHPSRSTALINNERQRFSNWRLDGYPPVGFLQSRLAAFMSEAS
jgi:hypothetical protein